MIKLIKALIKIYQLKNVSIVRRERRINKLRSKTIKINAQT